MVARDGTCTAAHETRAGDPVRTADDEPFQGCGIFFQRGTERSRFWMDWNLWWPGTEPAPQRTKRAPGTSSEPPTPAFSGLRTFLRGALPFVNASRTMALSIVHRHLPQPSAADFGLIEIYGGQGRNRTADASLFRAALYRLSYLAKLFCRTRNSVRPGRKFFLSETHEL
jgi:hypothetical protein